MVIAGRLPQLLGTVAGSLQCSTIHEPEAVKAMQEEILLDGLLASALTGLGYRGNSVGC